ncbi:hypothetical protein Tco_0556164 [Tanacetum coccineum]
MSNTNTNLQTQTSSVLQNDTVSSCSISNIQEKSQLSRSRCMHSLKEIKTDCTTTLTNLRTKFENAFNSEFEERMRKYTRYNAQSFNDAMICTIDSIRKYMLEIILHQQRTLHLLKQKTLMQTQEDHSNQTQALNSDSLKVDLVVKQNSCSEKEDSNSETASNKSAKECSLNSEPQDVHAIKYKMSKAKERCMAYFRSLHSHLQVLSKDDLKGTRIEHGFKRAFMSLFGQDVDTFTRTMLTHIRSTTKGNLTKDKFQDDGSITAFWVVNNQFKVLDSKFNWIMKSKDRTTRHQRQYERRVNKRQMQMQESKIDTGKALDVDLVDTESIRTGHQHTELPEIIVAGGTHGSIFKSVGLGGYPTGKLFDSCTSKVDSEPPHGSNVDIPNIHECKQTLDSMAAEKADISETIVKVDSQMMIQKNDVCSQQFRPQTSMSNDVCSQQFRPQTSMSNDV